jgi:hypothetical protein
MANKNTKIHTAQIVVDINAADDTSAYSFDVPFDGYLVLGECYAVAEEATGTQSSTQGVVSIEVGGVEVGTLTADISQSIGHTQTFTPDGTNVTAANPVYKVTAGDAVEAITKTQAVGGTVTGTYRVSFALDSGQ